MNAIEDIEIKDISVNDLEEVDYFEENNSIYIPIDEITTKTPFLNRTDEDEITNDQTFFSLMESIRERSGLINPITVSAVTSPLDEGIDDDSIKYAVVAGMRRYLAFKILYETTGEEIYKNIPAIVRDVSPQERAQIMIHENKFRKNPTVEQSFESVVSIIPFIFGKGRLDDAELNFRSGYTILELYIRVINYRGERKIEDTESFKKLVLITGNTDPISEINRFLADMGEAPNYFWKKRKVLEFETSIRDLYSKKIIALPLAIKLDNLFKRKLNGVVELVDKIKDEVLTRIEILKNIERIEKDNADIVEFVEEKEKKKIMANFKRINKAIKGNKIDKVSADAIAKHILEIKKIIKKSKE